MCYFIGTTQEYLKYSYKLHGIFQHPFDVGSSMLVVLFFFPVFANTPPLPIFLENDLYHPFFSFFESHLPLEQLIDISLSYSISNKNKSFDKCMAHLRAIGNHCFWPFQPKDALIIMSGSSTSVSTMEA